MAESDKETCLRSMREKRDRYNHKQKLAKDSIERTFYRGKFFAMSEAIAIFEAWM